MLLKDKICLVTGAGKGIGRAVVERFAEEGASKIYANDVERGSLDDLSFDNCVIVPLYFDVSDNEECTRAIKLIKRESGRLDVLVNNAGIMKDALIGTISRKLIEDLFRVNVFGMIDLLQLSSKLMNDGGSIINLSSIVGITGNPGQLVYSATKGAVISMTKTAAKELAYRGIRVNAIAPGMIDTDMMRSIGSKHLSRHISNIPMKRLGTPREIADACVYLSSEMSTYVTGHVLSVDASVVV